MIIAIEGIDGSGKNTQANLLLNKLEEQGKKVILLGFPCYSETFFGKEVGCYLNGEFGGLDVVSPKLASMLYAGDRYEKKSSIINALNDGCIIIIDRYVSSNIAHQSAKLVGNERSELQRWIEKLEYEVYGLPKADLNILLNLDADHSSKLVLKKDARDYTDKSKDLHEEDSTYLEKVANVYQDIASKSGKWTIIDCLNDNKLKSIEDISNEVFGAVSLLLK
ncbi:dTMP kinase [Photobacterium kagoshimensis]|uniref:dTMP kinase n=1 Tax=Photobacterium kagoshimensis TaxID=2910242 RepID=UPI003D1348D3